LRSDHTKHRRTSSSGVSVSSSLSSEPPRYHHDSDGVPFSSRPGD
jgi:hypothetical protein